MNVGPTSGGELLTTQRTRFELWLGMVVFGRLYTVLICDLPAHGFGVDWTCHTRIHDIPSYLWVEILFYGPVIWFALFQLNTDVFGDVPADPLSLRRHRRRQLVGAAASAVFFYGVGIHAADLIEVLSREREGITDGAVYELAYYLDEGLSHYVQFVSLFFLLGWFVIFDRRGRTDRRHLALFFGVAHGVERGLGIIEGEKWFLGPAVIVWMAAAVWLRWRRVGAAVLDEFLVHYAVAFILLLPTTQAAYYLWLGEFTPPSNLDDDTYIRLMILTAGLTIAGTGAVIAFDRRLLHRRDRVHPPVGGGT